MRLLAALFAVVTLVLASHAADARQRTVNVYNWNDYIGPDTIAQFQAETGIRVNYDVYDSNDILEAKLLAGRSGYDVVFPTAKPYAERHIHAGLYLPLDREKLPHLANLDPKILAALEEVDPGNRHILPYMWGTTGIGYNVDRVRAVAGGDAPVESWALLFDPAIVARLGACGISFLDEAGEGFGAAFAHLGIDPATTEAAHFDAAEKLFQAVRPHVRYFHSGQYINDLANGEVCVAHGYSGDVLQARDRAREAGRDFEIAYVVPKEGAAVWTDVMAIPADAPNPDEAHAFIDFMMRPDVIAEASNAVAYANANMAATDLVDDDIRSDPGIYPPPEVKERLFTLPTYDQRTLRTVTRTWTRIRTGR